MEQIITCRICMLTFHGLSTAFDHFEAEHPEYVYTKPNGQRGLLAHRQFSGHTDADDFYTYEYRWRDRERIIIADEIQKHQRRR